MHPNSHMEKDFEQLLRLLPLSIRLQIVDKCRLRLFTTVTVPVHFFQTYVRNTKSFPRVLGPEEKLRFHLRSLRHCIDVSKQHTHGVRRLEDKYVPEAVHVGKADAQPQGLAQESVGRPAQQGKDPRHPATHAKTVGALTGTPERKENSTPS